MRRDIESQKIALHLPQEPLMAHANPWQPGNVIVLAAGTLGHTLSCVQGALTIPTNFH
jgi:hypothetical protein